MYLFYVFFSIICVLVQFFIIVKLSKVNKKYQNYFYQFRSLFFLKILDNRSPNMVPVKTIEDVFYILDENTDTSGLKIVSPDYINRPDLVIPSILSKTVKIDTFLTENIVKKTD